ncbi:MAG: hypothetical protein WCE23_05190 [Candidatus Binatus sp.]|uniref:hypothetical protein n=1 Tax=Candidatus Binatus sp. TaxID=2811406 RepID=UPI003C77441D
MAQAAMIALMGLVFAVTLPLLSRSAFAGSDELLTYKSREGTLGGPCDTSNYETCPGLNCSCLSSRGSASSDLTGPGYAAFDMMVALEVVDGCQEFNASIFIIAPRDLEELDFSGTACDELSIFSGYYVLAISQAGYSGSGTVSGRINGASGKPNSVVFRFHQAAPGR